MFKNYIERIIREYLNSPSYGSSPTPIQETGLFDNNRHHLAVRKIANGFLLAFYDGSEAIYCATEKDLADQIIAKAARSKMSAAEKHGSATSSLTGVGTGHAAQSLYNNQIAGRI